MEAQRWSICAKALNEMRAKVFSDRVLPALLREVPDVGASRVVRCCKRCVPAGGIGMKDLSGGSRGVQRSERRMDTSRG